MVREVLIARPSQCVPTRRRHDDPGRVAQRIGAYLLRTDRRPDGIVALDPLGRLLAEKAAKAMGLAASSVAAPPKVRQADARTLVSALHVLPGGRLLAFGELPGVELPSGPLLAVETGRRKGIGVTEVVDRDALPRTFPFPTPAGVEQRTRPAYYYYQSGVVPYRRARTGHEILLVATRKKKRWVIPKGVHDPGFSAPESAAKEAFEEAGVLGEVGDSCLGSYHVEKWGATCTVAVFPMRVTRVLDRSAWPESDRGRRWFKASKAASKIHRKDLAALVAAFAKTL